MQQDTCNRTVMSSGATRAGDARPGGAFALSQSILHHVFNTRACSSCAPQTIPGLPTRPGFYDVDLDITVDSDGEEHARVVGLF